MTVLLAIFLSLGAIFLIFLVVSFIRRRRYQKSQQKRSGFSS
jgi:predicted permease